MKAAIPITVTGLKSACSQCNLVELCLARGGPGAAFEAFACVEQAKSRSLQELLLKSAVPGAPHPTGKSDIVRRVGELREELNWYYHRIEAEQLSPEESAEVRLDQLRSAVSAHEAELLRVLRDLPLSAESRDLLAPVSLPLESVRAAIPADAMIRGSTRSESQPASGETRDCTTGCTTRIAPAVSTARPRKTCRYRLSRNGTPNVAL